MQISKENANDLFFELLDVFANSDKNFIHCKGSAGSGKSYAIQQYIIISCLLYKNIKWLCCRAFAATLTHSVEDVFVTILDEFKISYKHNKSKRSFTFINGSSILLAGLDNVEKLKSISNISNIWIEEATELEFVNKNPISIIDSLLFRLRGKNAVGVGRGKIITSFNPLSVFNFLKKNFYDISRNDCYYSNTTYLNNKFLGIPHSVYLKKFQYLLTTNIQLYNSLVLGEWGMDDVANKLYVSFSNSKHINDCCYDNTKDLILSFDENVNPYVTCLVSQSWGDNINIIDEICISGNLQLTMNNFVQKYNFHKNKIIIYGDATSNKGNVHDVKFYREIQNYLEQAGFVVVNKVSISNLPVMTRINWINTLFLFENLKIRINQKCEKLIVDLNMITSNKNGDGKNKTVENGVEKYGHTSDAFEYLMTGVYRNIYDEYIRGNSKAIKSVGRVKKSYY